LCPVAPILPYTGRFWTASPKPKNSLNLLF